MSDDRGPIENGDASEKPKEPDRKPPPINPFEAARTRPIDPDIRVGWSVRDLQMLRPDWTEEQCQAFLLRHARQFAAGMIRMGLAVLAEMANDPHFTSSNGDGKRPPHDPQNN